MLDGRREGSGAGSGSGTLPQIKYNIVAGRKRQALDDRLEEDSFLPPEQERAMIELDESVEALDSAIEYKNDILLRVRDRRTT
jgi:hypothetical protein